VDSGALSCSSNPAPSDPGLIAEYGGLLAADHIDLSIELIEFRAMISSAEQPRRDDWKAPLRARFPRAKSADFGCFKGWESIVTRMLERLEATIAQEPAAFRRGLKIDGIRQKFGMLSVYLSKVPTPEVQAVLDETLAASLVTCEVCGAPGRLAERRAWISVKCDAHENWTRFDDIGG
jgi:hypothetical protein